MTLGVLTLWSPVSVVVTLVYLLRSPLLTAPSAIADLSQKELTLALVGLLVVILLTVSTLVVLTATTLYYGVHILRNPKLSDGQKVAWSLTNVTVGLFLMPIYFFLHVRGEETNSRREA